MKIEIMLYDGERAQRATLDFDKVMGVAPTTLKMRDMDGKPIVHEGTQIFYIGGMKLVCTDKYEDICEQWR